MWCLKNCIILSWILCLLSTSAKKLLLWIFISSGCHIELATIAKEFMNNSHNSGTSVTIWSSSLSILFACEQRAYCIPEVFGGGIILPAARVSPLEVHHSMLPFFALGAWISGSWTTFSWLQDVLFTHVQGIVILWAKLI